MAESKEELKSLVMRVKEESKKAGLKLNIQKTKIMASGPITSWQRLGNSRSSDRLFSWTPKITADGDCSHGIKRHLLLGRKAMTNLDSILKSRDTTLSTKFCLIKAKIFFSNSHVQMWELAHKGVWAAKNWFFQIVVLEKTLESPLDFKDIKPVHPKGNQPWIFIGRTDGNLLQYSCLENSMDRGAWWVIVHEVTKNRTRQSD